MHHSGPLNLSESTEHQRLRPVDYARHHPAQLARFFAHLFWLSIRRAVMGVLLLSDAVAFSTVPQWLKVFCLSGGRAEATVRD